MECPDLNSSRPLQKRKIDNISYNNHRFFSEFSTIFFFLFETSRLAQNIQITVKLSRVIKVRSEFLYVKSMYISYFITNILRLSPNLRKPLCLEARDWLSRVY
jgi:hypothetical protein